jgi:hypothetical protein
MDDKLIPIAAVAITAAVTAALAVYASRRNRKNALKVEEYKAQAAREQQAYDQASSAIQEISGVLQKIKDLISLIIIDINNPKELKAHKTELTTIGSMLSTEYGKGRSVLDKMKAVIAHDSLHQVTHLQAIIRDLIERKNVHEKNDRYITVLTEMRKSVSNLQDKLQPMHARKK